MPLFELTVDELAEITSADIVKGNGDARIHYVATDTRDVAGSIQRKAGEGSVFIALRGERYDGHNFIDRAIDLGTGVIISSRDISIASNSVATLLVEDTTRALMDLANWVRKSLSTTFIGITGTTGKTTTKDIISGLLKTKYKVYETRETTNNEFGVPLNILNMEGDEDYAVIEVGTNRPGEIGLLSSVLEPEIGVATNIGMGHIEFFNSIPHIAKEKESLFKVLPEDGCAILNAEDEYVRSFNTDARKFTYGLIESADLKPDSWEDLDGGGLRFTIEGVEFNSPLCGIHNLMNILASISCALAVGFEISECVEPVSRLRPTKSRLELIKVGEILIIDDAYNANPLSMRRSLEWFASISDVDRRFLVLGDMLELGEESVNSHTELGELVGRYLKEGDVYGVFYAGDYGDSFSGGIKKVINETEEVNLLKKDRADSIIEELSGTLDDGDAVLFKASNSIGLSEVANSLILELEKRG